MKHPDVARGVALFDAGRYWDAHEAWEGPWRAAPPGSEKSLLQALILWAAALHQHRRGLTHGARTLLSRSLRKLEGVSHPAFGIELEPLRDALVDCWSQLERGKLVEVVQLSTLHGAEPSTGLELDHRAICPYCGEPVLVSVEAELTGGTTYVEDCPVCCRPWEVRVLGGETVTVELGRSDD